LLNNISSQVQTWIEEINAACLDKLQTLHHDFKYIVSTVVVQKVGAGERGNARIKV
jgi:hypothetical protein